MVGLDLTSNPFFLLKTDPRADRERLAEALEDALFEPGADEARLVAAFHTLTVPLPRLQAELEWLGGSISADCAAALLAGTAPDPVLGGISPLATANIAAHFCVWAETATEQRELAVSCLAGAHTALDPVAIAEGVNADRKASGFPAVEERLVEQGLHRLRAAHRDNALRALLGLPQPANVLTRLLHDHGGKDRAAPFLVALAEAFDSIMLPEQTRRAAAAEAAIWKVREDGGIDTAAEALSAWAELARPRQLLMAAHLLDEPRSLALGAIVRDTVQHLEKQTGRAAALDLVRAGRNAFAPLPGLSQTLARDEARIAAEDTLRPAPAAPVGIAASTAVERPPTAVIEPVFETPSIRLVAERRTFPPRRQNGLLARLLAWLEPHPLWRLGLCAAVALAAFVIVVIASSASPRPEPEGPGRGTPQAKPALSDRR